MVNRIHGIISNNSSSRSSHSSQWLSMKVQCTQMCHNTIGAGVTSTPLNVESDDEKSKDAETGNSNGTQQNDVSGLSPDWDLIEDTAVMGGNACRTLAFCQCQMYSGVWLHSNHGNSIQFRARIRTFRTYQQKTKPIFGINGGCCCDSSPNCVSNRKTGLSHQSEMTPIPPHFSHRRSLSLFVRYIRCRCKSARNTFWSVRVHWHNNNNSIDKHFHSVLCLSLFLLFTVLNASMPRRAKCQISSDYLHNKNNCFFPIFIFNRFCNFLFSIFQFER